MYVIIIVAQIDCSTNILVCIKIGIVPIAMANKNAIFSFKYFKVVLNVKKTNIINVKNCGNLKAKLLIPNNVEESQSGKSLNAGWVSALPPK